MSTAQDKVNQIAALIDAWRQNDSPEGEMSAGWVLGQIREMLGLSDIEAQSHALKLRIGQLDTELRNVRTELGRTILKDQRPAPLTEEEARRWAEGLLPDWKGARRILPGALLAASRGEIPPEVRQSESDEQGEACSARWDLQDILFDQPCILRGPHQKHRTAYFQGRSGEWSDASEAPGQVAPGQRPISAPLDTEANDYLASLSDEKRLAMGLRRLAHIARHEGYPHRAQVLDDAAEELHPLPDLPKLQPEERHLLAPFLKPGAQPIDPDSGTRETSIPEKPESSPPVAEMAVVLGTGDDAGPASEDLDANKEANQ